MLCRPLFFHLCLSAGLLGLTCATPAGEKEPERESRFSPGRNFHLSMFTANDHLPQTQVTCIKQTHDGFLWVGTWVGLARFDGLHFEVFDKFNTPDLVSSEINGLAEDAEGTLWITTRAGLVSYRDKRFTRWSTNQGLPGDELWRMKPEAEGVWVDGSDSLTRVHNGRVQSTQKMPFRGPILSMCESKDGGMHVLMCEHWLTCYAEQGAIRTNLVADPPFGGWTCALFDPDGKGAWIGTSRTLLRLSDGKITPQPITDGKTEGVNLLYRDRSGALWAATAQGLFRRKDGLWEVVLPEARMPAGMVSLEQDAEGNFWAATYEGLLQLQPLPIKTFTVAEGLAHNEARSICEGEDGTIWVLTVRGLSRIRSDRVVPLDTAELGSFLEGKSVWPQKGGGVWIGRVGLTLHDFSNREFHDWKGKIPAESVNAICEDNQGRVWFAGSEGLVCAASNEITCYSNIFPAGVLGKIFGLAADSQGTIWIGTRNNGLLHLVNGHYSSFSEKDGLGPGAIFSIHEDADKALWLGTENGLVRFKNGRFFTFGPASGLVERNINCVLEDDFGYLWVSGLHGICALERARLNDVAEGRPLTVPCFVVGEADGMVIVESNGGENQPAGWKARDGRLWFPTLAGVVVIDPKTIPVREPPPQIHFQQVKANNEALALPGTQNNLPPLHIKAGARALEFVYTAPTFVEPERTRFRYRLTGIGIGDKWSEPTSDRFARFYNLRPGKYRFEVLAANRHNVWTTQPLPLDFTIAQFFWQTWTFYALCAGAAAALAAFVHRYRLRWQHRLLKLEEQRALSNERSRIARDLHDDIGGSLTGIALQLEAARRRGSANKDELATLAEESRSLSRQLRELAWTTNPRCDNTISLAAFIGESAERFCHAAGMQCRLTLPDTQGVEEVPARVRYELLAVLKESLANTARHAAARTVTVDLAALNGDLRLTIHDDGKGFDPAAPAAGSGLKNLRERVHQAGGSVRFESNPGAGTTVIATLPRKPADKQ